ncbi:unnamed protein product [Effrenium voratum]|uniref:Uncharacterized protein n=3 Tax=Effrenium voratum TaxID=2562239 RepID=A0AA36MSG3_9DINO|nr:unnamed protein product [Effrenium voratum]CAJ1454101.1 unnamed protein product [Effrenium voratum]
MAKLLSHHDRYHSHAILGLLALLHFAYRFYIVLIEWRESFVPNFWSAASLSVHVFLHVLSFQFDLPRNRIWTKPMIWREFRVHNAIFAYRHLVGSALGIWAADWWWQRPTVLSVVVKVSLVLAACKAADVATEMIGSTEARTTNSMPYPKKTSETIEQVAKKFYAKSQFAATALAAFGTPSLSFCSILAIELASLLMTLVRKGIIEARTYHIVYAFSLFIMFPCLVATIHSGDELAEMAAFRGLTACALAVDLRLTYGFSKYITWAISIVGGYFLVDMLCPVMGVTVFKWFFAWPGMMWSAADTLRSFYNVKDKSWSNEGAAQQAETEKKADMDPQPAGDEGHATKEEVAKGSFPYVTPSLG